MTQYSIESLLDEIYQAALDRTHWPIALEKIGDALKAASGIIGLQRYDELAWVQATRIDPYYLEVMAAEYASANTNPFVGNLDIMPVGKAISLEEGFLDIDFKKSAAYHALNKASGLEEGVTVIAARRNTLAVIYGFMRSAGKKDFSSAERVFLEKLAPHIRRAVEIDGMLMQANQQVDAFQTLLDQLSTAVILLNSQGMPVYCNAAAERIIAANDGLGIYFNSVSAIYPVAHRALAQAINQALQTDGSAPPAAVEIPRPSGFPPYIVVASLMPFPRDTWQYFTDDHRIILLITDPSETPPTAAELFRLLYQLSPAEVRVTESLAEGLSLQETADRLFISLNTAKTHLKHIFTKTNTGRQTELIRVIANLNSSLVARTLAK